ncbi:MAG: hypothetical protein ACTSWY_13245 [Promethearchaeota archaeon]
MKKIKNYTRLFPLVIKKMTPSKRKKNRFTQEEKALIRRLRQELKNSKTPREQWANIVQDEILRYRKKLAADRKSQSLGGIRRLISRSKENIKSKIGGLFSKFIQRRMLKSIGDDADEETIKKVMDIMSGQENTSTDFNRGFMASGAQERQYSLDDVGKNSTFLTKDIKKQKKKVEVFFDEEED